MFTQTDEPLTFVAHGDNEIFRVSKTSHADPRTWLLELFCPAGRFTFVLDEGPARELAALFNTLPPKNET